MCAGPEIARLQTVNRLRVSNFAAQGFGKNLCCLLSNICASDSFVCERKLNTQERASHCDQLLHYKKAPSSFKISHLQTFVVHDSRWRLGGKKQQTSLKKKPLQTPDIWLHPWRSISLIQDHQVQLWSRGWHVGTSPGKAPRQDRHQMPHLHCCGGADTVRQSRSGTVICLHSPHHPQLQHLTWGPHQPILTRRSAHASLSLDMSHCCK